MFGKLFNDNNPFWKGMGRIFDVCQLNLLWLFCCIPVITIGPSTTAFYYAMINLVRGEETYLSRDFFRSFRRNFKQSLLVGLLLTGLGAFLVLDVYIARHSGTGIYTFFMVFFFIIFVLWSFVALYTFPLLAKFEYKTKDLFIMAFTLSVKHFPQTLLMLLVLAFALWVCHLLPGLIFIAFGLVCEFHANIFDAMFRPWLPKVGGEPEDGGEDEP